MLYVDQTKIGKGLIDTYGFLWVKGINNSRAVLSTLIAGIISLTVFSFSMVMIVLNQASSNFSPRIIPGLITDKANQIVLGFYIGTIVYCLILLHNIAPEKANVSLPLIGIFFAEILGVLCLSMFVYFIHTISQSIQIDQIIERIFRKTLKKIKNNDEQASNSSEINSGQWQSVKSISSGYFRKINEKSLLEIALKNNLIIEVMPEPGNFVHEGDDLFKLDKKNVNEKIQKKILENFIFHEEELIEENFIYGFKQLSEIAVKALSPGINDPGTALKAINELSTLCSEYIKRNNLSHFCDKENKVRIIQKEKSLDEVLFRYITPILTYGKKDILIIEKLLISIKYLLRICINKGNEFEVLKNYINKILIECDAEIKNKFDREKINLIVIGIMNSFNVNEIKPLSMNQ